MTKGCLPRETYPREKAVRCRCKLRYEIASILSEGNGTGIAASFQRFKRDGKAQGGGILRTGNPAANCMHTPDRSIHERGRSQDEVTLLHPRLPLHPTARKFRGDNAVKIGRYFIVGAIIKKRSKGFTFGGLLAERRGRSVKTCGNLVTEGGINEFYLKLRVYREIVFERSYKPVMRFE